MLVALFLTFNIFNFGESNMEAKIVGGKKIDIAKFPYIAFIAIHCRDEMAWQCGSSILNQKLLITAGHCVAGCLPRCAIIARVGHRNYDQGHAYLAHSFMKHENYNGAIFAHDIALVRLKSPMQFGATVQRIALMEYPPYGEMAMVAGWGLINEYTVTYTKQLQLVTQKVHKPSFCKKRLHSLPKGTFCASNGDKNRYVSFGDSGGPLVVRHYIQIGLVSYKVPRISSDIVVYTDTGYFFSWIEKNSKILLYNCNK